VAALLISLALFGAAWLVHLVWWRVRLPRRQSMALLAVFAVVPLLAAAAGGARFIAAAEVPAAAALYLGAVGCYLILYTGVEQTSPTLVIVRALQAARPRGCSAEELAQLVTDELFVRPRLEALVADGIAAATADGWVLTARGRRTARLAAALARVLRIEERA
jgi:hypothetical protein